MVGKKSPIPCRKGAIVLQPACKIADLMPHLQAVVCVCDLATEWYCLPWLVSLAGAIVLRLTSHGTKTPIYYSHCKIL